MHKQLAVYASLLLFEMLAAQKAWAVPVGGETSKPAAKATKATLPEPAAEGLRLYHRAVAEAKGFDDDEALKDLAEELRIWPFPAAYVLKGDCLQHIGKAQEAIAMYKLALKLTLQKPLSPTNSAVDSISRLADAYRAEKRFSEITSLWTMVIDKTHDPTAYLERAKCEVETKDFAKAEADFKIAAKNPNNLVTANRALASLYMQTGRPKDALNMLNQTVANIDAHGANYMDRYRYKIFSERAACYRALGDETNARKDQKRYDGAMEELFGLTPFRQNTRSDSGKAAPPH